MRTKFVFYIKSLFLTLLFIAGYSQMSNAAETHFTTRSYIQGNNALTDLVISRDRYVLTMRGDVMDDNMPGVGIFEGELSELEKQELAKAATVAKQYPGFTPAPLIDRHIKAFYATGERRVKLDASLALEPSEDKLLVGVSFRNTGTEEICLKSPSTWEGKFNPISGSSWIRVSGILSGTLGREAEQRIRTPEFGGAELANIEDFLGETFCIAPKQIKTAKFLVFPTARIRKGVYTVAASITVSDVFAPKELGPSLEFFSVRQTVSFSRDYPSTPEEIKAFSIFLKSNPQE
jgi:hypothetical protein